MTPDGTEARAPAPREKAMNRAAVRRYLAEHPDLVLEDAELGQRIVEAANAGLGSNVIDMQGAVMHRMRRRLRAIEVEREEMIDAATENMVSMNSIHDAVLTMLEAPTFSEFIEIVGARFGTLLKVDSIRLCLESELADDGAPKPQGSTLMAVHPGDVERFFHGMGWGVTLRPVEPETLPLHTDQRVTSEALVRLDFGEGTRPGVLVFGALDPDRFHDEQGGELLVFLGGAISRVMRRWLDGAGMAAA